MGLYPLAQAPRAAIPEEIWPLGGQAASCNSQCLNRADRARASRFAAFEIALRWCGPWERRARTGPCRVAPARRDACRRRPRHGRGEPDSRAAGRRGDSRGGSSDGRRAAAGAPRGTGGGAAARWASWGRCDTREIRGAGGAKTTFKAMMINSTNARVHLGGRARSVPRKPSSGGAGAGAGSAHSRLRRGTSRALPPRARFGVSCELGAPLRAAEAPKVTSTKIGWPIAPGCAGGGRARARTAENHLTPPSGAGRKRLEFVRIQPKGAEDAFVCTQETSWTVRDVSRRRARGARSRRRCSRLQPAERDPRLGPLVWSEAARRGGADDQPAGSGSQPHAMKLSGGKLEDYPTAKVSRRRRRRTTAR